MAGTEDFTPEDIVRHLAATNPTGIYEDHCGLCLSPVYGMLDAPAHGEMCPWRLAVEWVARQA